MVIALVVHDYKAQQPDELTITRGDIITHITFHDGGWSKGTVKGGKTGMFPDNFVKVIEDNVAPPKNAPVGRKCRVNFQYKPEIEDELELQVGDLIEVISEVEPGWWRGKLRNKTGVFPSNFVVELTEEDEKMNKETKPGAKEQVTTNSSHSTGNSNASNLQSISSRTLSESTFFDLPQLPPKPMKEKEAEKKELCKVIFNYDAENADELTLHKGDIVTLISKDGKDPGWWKGELKGKIGVFPENFVQIIPEETFTSRPTKVTGSNARDSLTKSAGNVSMVNYPSFNRKLSDASKSDPPSVSKKPVVPPPPPQKKPQRSPSDLSKSPTAPNLLSASKSVETSPTSSTSTSRVSSQMNVTTSVKHSSVVSESSSSSSSKWTVLDSDAADGALWSKGSYNVTSESNMVSVVTGSSSMTSSREGPDPDLDLVERAAMLTHPTASRVKAPKRRPPSTVIIKEELTDTEEIVESEKPLETTQSPTSSSASSSSTMLNGDAGTHQDKPSKVPWVEELKLNQAKKSMQVAAGRTRVMIGAAETVTSSSSAVSPEAPKPTVAGVTLRSHQTAAPRPHSMVTTLRSALVSPQSSDSSVTLTAKQWNELIEKVSRLELQFETQIGHLNKTVQELFSKLDDERQLTARMQQEIEKLTDLVTQV